jgi:hypothetical protein
MATEPARTSGRATHRELDDLRVPELVDEDVTVR